MVLLQDTDVELELLGVLGCGCTHLDGANNPLKTNRSTMMKQNLEATVLAYSMQMAKGMKAIALDASSEEDVRHGCNTLIDTFLEISGIAVRGRHEYGLAGGQIDSKYAGVILEYKNPKGTNRVGENLTSRGTKALLVQLKQRFHDFESEENLPPEKLLGVGTDGHRIVFVRYRGRNFEVDGPIPVDERSVERLLRALISLGARGESYTAEQIARDFGSESVVAKRGVYQLYRALIESKSPKTADLFRQWQILFSEVSGFTAEKGKQSLTELAAQYSLPSSAGQPQLLFSLQTYYAIFMKLLAAEIASVFSPLSTSPAKRWLNAPSMAALKREVQQLDEEGGIWTQLGITNFLEGDLFTWYLDEWTNSVADVFREIVLTFDHYDPSTLSVDPEDSQDLLKNIYQQLFPKSLRRTLGEYYTPDWLADFTLDEIGYNGNPETRILDPACGSGTFLIRAIRRVRAWFQENRYECGYDEQGLAARILSNIIGFDLNPLAVLAARTNYLLALRDLLRYCPSFEIPVYLCDSIVTPAEYGDLFIGGPGKGKKLNTAVGPFIIPTEVTHTRELLGHYTSLVELCIRLSYSPDEFLSRCHEEGIPTSTENLHTELYTRLSKLKADKRNGIWARIIKNAFAPLFIGRVDLVAGNPPWINWLELPDDYREQSEHIWRDYDLLTQKGWKARVAAGRTDLAILFALISLQSYLRPEGVLGFVLPQPIFKSSGGGEGFRRFRLLDTTFAPVRVHDLSLLNVFEDAVNRPAVATFQRDSLVHYPIPYVMWQPTGRRGTIPPEISLEDLEQFCKPVEQIALPSIKSNPLSQWLTGSPQIVKAISKTLGSSTYRAREGVNWGGALGVFQLAEVREHRAGLCLVTNDLGRTKLEVKTAVVEDDLVFPLLKGRDVKRWVAHSRLHILLTHVEEDPKLALSETDMKVKFPKAYAYFKAFEKELRSRKEYQRWGGKAPFYELYRIGPYTFAPYKVVFKDLTNFFQCAVVPPHPKIVIPDYTLRMIPFDELDEAYFVAGLLNSRAATLALHATSTGVQTQRYHASDVEKILIPSYERSNRLHRDICEASRNCHTFAAAENFRELGQWERNLDRLSCQVWEISDSELESIAEELTRIGYEPGRSEEGVL